MKTFALIALLAGSTLARAAGVSLLTPVIDDPVASVVPEVREQCKLEERLTGDVGEALGAGTTTSTAGDVVRLTIVDVLDVGGGSWSGPKAITVRVEVSGKVSGILQ